MTITNAIITFYCACTLCCGHKSDTNLIGITASGKKATEGITIAAGNRNIPLGTKVIIDKKEYIVQDRMHKKYDGSNRFDIYISNHERAKKMGVKKNKTVEIKN